MAKDALRLLIKSDFIWDERYKSDFNHEYYQAQGAVTPLLTGVGALSGGAARLAGASESFRQQLILINTKDMINGFRGRMKASSESFGKIQGESQASGGA